MIGDTLKNLRDKMGLSQKAFAERYDMNPGTLASYELGKREPNIGTLIKFSHIYGVSVDYLIGNSLPGFGDYKNVLDKYGPLSDELHESLTQMLNAGISIGKSDEVFEALIKLKDCIRNIDTAISTSVESARESVKRYNIPLLKEIDTGDSPDKESEKPSNMLYMLSFMSYGIDKATLAKDELTNLLDMLLKGFSLELLNLRFRLAYMKDEAEREGADNGNGQATDE